MGGVSHVTTPTPHPQFTDSYKELNPLSVVPTLEIDGHILTQSVSTHTYIHYMCTYIHTYIHTYMHTCIHTYIHTYMHTYIHTYIHTYTTYIHTYTYIKLCMYMYTLHCAAAHHRVPRRDPGPSIPAPQGQSHQEAAGELWLKKHIHLMSVCAHLYL